MASSAPWVDGPFPLVETPAYKSQQVLPSEYIANDMALAHNTFIRSLNSIYLQADGVTKEKDIADFLFYCQCWIRSLHHHHHTEETTIFPRLEEAVGQKGLMDRNVEQHHAFLPGLDAYEQYVKSTPPANFSSKKLKEIIDSFAAKLVEHLHEEIQTLVDLKQWDPEGKLRVDYDKAVAELITSIDMHTDFPWFLANHDKSYENGVLAWPPVPFFVPYLIKYWYSRKHAGAWRFCSCDYFGKPRPLQFLPNAK